LWSITLAKPLVTTVNIPSISGLIASLAFVVLVVCVCYVLLKLLNSLRVTLANLDRTLTESTRALEHINTELDKVDEITTYAVNSAKNVSQTVDKFNDNVREPLRVVSELLGVGLGFFGLKNDAKKGRKGDGSRFSRRDFRAISEVIGLIARRIRKKKE
jgi:uncharacterized protein YoxC